jgi:hypothetical protein
MASLLAIVAAFDPLPLVDDCIDGSVASTTRGRGQRPVHAGDLRHDIPGSSATVATRRSDTAELGRNMTAAGELSGSGR